MSAPKLFISYSWSSPDHEAWVMDLATRLVESGVDVLLDKWSLREGNDTVSFMEKMVTDPSIQKVAVISDRVYAQKADGRSGGVGTETQIISREVYEKQDQSKFVAVLPERDELGKFYLPTYYKGRIYIDLSRSENYESEFERLLRWIFDKPIYVKPEIGRPPSFLDDAVATSLGTTASHRRALDAVRSAKPYAVGALEEYFQQFSENLERFRLPADSKTADLQARILASIESFSPFKSEYLQVVSAVCKYTSENNIGGPLHKLFESLMPYLDRPRETNSWHSWAFDNFRFIVHELFLSTIAVLLREERFAAVNHLLQTPYFLSWNAERGRSATVSFSEIRESTDSIDRLGKPAGRISARADLLKKRAESSGFEFGFIMQADFVLFLRASIADSADVRWWPDSLVFATHFYGPMEVFARSVSKAYFDRAAAIFGGIALDKFKTHVENLAADRASLPRWEFDRIEPKTLSGLDKLGSVP